MRTYTHNLIAEHGALLGYGFPVNKAHAAKGTWVKRAKNVALFFAAPFVGLAYLLAFPVIGLALLAYYAGKAVMANKKTRTVVLTVAAPAIALAFLTIGPVVGIGALAWTGAKALVAG